MDMTSVVKNEVFRPLVTIVIPGAIAIFPFVLFVNGHFPALAVYRDTHEPVYFTVVALLTLCAGMLMGDLGTYVEDWFDKLLAHRYPKALEQWYAYLRQDTSAQTIGHGYLRAALLYLRFELTLGLALLPFYFGMFLVNHQTSWFSVGFMIGLGIGLLMLGLLLILEAISKMHIRTCTIAI